MDVLLRCAARSASRDREDNDEEDEEKSVRRPRMGGQFLDHALAERHATIAQAALVQVSETHLGQHLAPAGVETLSSCRGTQGSLLWRRGIQELTRAVAELQRRGDRPGAVSRTSSGARDQVGRQEDRPPNRRKPEERGQCDGTARHSQN